MGDHLVNEGSAIPVFRQSDLYDQKGTLYNGEVFINLGVTTGYLNSWEVRFRNSNGDFDSGFISSSVFGGLHTYGKRITDPTLGSCYRFKTRTALVLVNNAGTIKSVLAVGDYIYTKSSTCGSSQPRNFKIIGYKKASGNVTALDGFATLNYDTGSMINSNFCIYGA